MPSVAQPRYSMFCFMLSAFPGPGLGSAGPRDAVTLCPVPSVPGVPMPSVPGAQWPVAIPGQHCTLLCRVQAVTLYEWLTSIAGSGEVTLGHLSQWWWFRMFLFIDIIQVDVIIS